MSENLDKAMTKLAKTVTVALTLQIVGHLSENIYHTIEELHSCVIRAQRNGTHVFEEYTGMYITQNKRSHKEPIGFKL